MRAGDRVVRASIQFDKNAPFHVIFPKDTSGAPTASNEQGVWEFEVRENLAMVQIAFAPKQFGCFRVPARVSIGRMAVMVYLNGASYVASEAMTDQRMDTLRRFLQTPSLVPPCVFDPAAKVGPPPKELQANFDLKPGNYK
jgi:hypothetical protein